MGELDIAAKALLRERPEAFVRLALPGREIRAVEPDETELQALERRMDKLLRVELAGEREPVWVHVEVEAAWGADVPERVFGYWSLAHPSRPALRSVVLVLRPGDRQADPSGVYEVSVLGARVLSFGFDVIRAWKLEAADLLERGDPGLLPLVPFTEGATPTRVDEAFRALASDPASVDLQVVLAVFSTRVFPGESWFAKIGKEFAMESSPLFDHVRPMVQRQVVARQLRIRLGKSKRTDALIARLSECGAPALDKLVDLLAGPKKKPQLLAAVERLLPKAGVS